MLQTCSHCGEDVRYSYTFGEFVDENNHGQCEDGTDHDVE